MNQARTHISLNVSDLSRAVEFYRSFLGAEPTKHFKDYAKFELSDPPLVLSLEPIYHRASDSFNHLGIRLSSEKAVLSTQERLRQAGLIVEREEGVECCYSRQTKFWLLDPDKNLWEVYALTGELAQRGSLSASDALAARDRAGALSSFEHRLGEPFPDPLPLSSDAVDEVRLRGTFNAPKTEEEKAAILRESFRVLRPGGQILIHGLVSDRVLEGGFPRLPGPAALVRHAPLENEALRLLEAHGFVGMYVQKLGESPNFKHKGASMRELLVCGFKPNQEAAGEARVVVYKGPFREVVDDAGVVYRRGERVTLEASAIARLQRGPLQDQFYFLRA